MFAVVDEKTWHPGKVQDITYHPACTKPSVQTVEDYNRLKEDIGANGIREPIFVQKSSGAVIAGRHRIKAALEVGVPIPVKVLDISDSECWSLSRSQLCHRNLSSTQAATLYLEMKELEEKARAAENRVDEEEGEDVPPGDDGSGKDEKKKVKPKAKKRAEKGSGKKSKQEAKEAGVSPATMERVKKVREKGIPAIWKAMDAGIVTSGDAAFIVDFDQDTQKKALAMVKDEKCKTLAAAKKLLDKEAADAAGPVLKDGKGKPVPKALKGVFEDRAQFAILKENAKELGKELAKLMKRPSAKHLPKDLVQQLSDMVIALDIYQPFAIKEDSEDGWITKRSANEAK